MKFDYSGYDLKFIQKMPCKDASAHLYTLIYKFYSPVTKYVYILNADYHLENVFAIKFYCKKDKNSDLKYSKIINKGDVGNILSTCVKVIPLLLQQYPTASFGFVGSITIDENSHKVESYKNNQRFRIYKHLMYLKFDNLIFEHFSYESASGYLLINKKNDNIVEKEKLITKMFVATYNNLTDIF